MTETNNILLFDDVDLFSMDREEFSPSPSSFELDLGGSNPDSFPTVLHRITSDESSDDCIHWLPCGTHFAISDKEKFSKKIIPIYFGSRGATKFTSFTRRLKRWKFTRISKGPQLGAYYHEFFVKDKPELLKKIVYPGAKVKTGAGSLSKSSPKVKVKSSNKARRRASTGSLPVPVIVGALSKPVIDDFISTPVSDPFVVAVNSISAPMHDEMLDISDKLDISPMPIKQTLKMPPDSPFLTKDFTNWLSDTAFSDNDLNSQSAHGLLSSPKEPASVVSNSSLLPPPPMSNTDLPFTVGVQRFKLPRRHSCIASIHSTTPSYNILLNDVGATANKDSKFGSMPTAQFHFPSTSTSSYNGGKTDEKSLPSANNTQNWPANVPKGLQQQIQQEFQQQAQQHVGGSLSQVGPSVVEQRLQQMQKQQAQLQQLQLQQLQQLQQSQFQKQQQKTQQQLQHFVGGLSAHEGQVADLEQQQQPSQSQSRRSSFQDELDDFFGLSRETTLEDFLNDSH